MQPKGAVELAVDEKLLTAAVIRIVEQGQDALVDGGGLLQRADGGQKCELKAGAEVKRFVAGKGGLHIFWGRLKFFPMPPILAIAAAMRREFSVPAGVTLGGKCRFFGRSAP